MSPRYDKDWIDKMLDVEWRLEGLAPRQFLLDAGLAEGQTFVDLGCGPGFFTLPAASIVGPEGKAYAVDIKQELLDMVTERAAARGMYNLIIVRSSGTSVPLDDAFADFVMCSLVVHYFSDTSAREAFLEDVSRVLKPGGKLLLIDWTTRDSAEGRYVGQDEVMPIVGRLGFIVDEVHALRDSQYWFVATRPSS